MSLGSSLAMSSGRKVSIATAYIVAAVAISAGVPGLLAFDSTGLTHEYGLFNISSEWRLVVFGATTLFALSVALLWDKIVTARAARGTEFFGLALLVAYFLWTAITTLIAVRTSSDLPLAFFRMFEWALTIYIVWQLLDPTSGDLEARFAQLIRAVSATALVVVLVMWVIVPSVAHTQGAGPFDMKLGLGGSAYHPNRLSVLFGIGAMYWWTTSGRPIRYLIAPLMLICCLATGSRSGIVGSAAGIVALVLLSFRGKSWSDRLLLQAGVLAVVAILLTAFLPQIIYFLSRGSLAEDFGTLNDRTNIWNASYILFERSPWIGHGYVVGPRLIGTVVSREGWMPTNGENELVNGVLAGGIPGALILIAIYGTIIVRSVRLRREHALLAVTGIPIVLSALFEPIISTPSTVIAVVVVGLIRTLGVVSAARSHQVARGSAARQRVASAKS